MKFRALPITDFSDITLDLEQLQGRDILDQTGESVLQLASTGTKRKVAWGSATVAFPNAQQATTLAVTHGLGATPATGLATVFGGVFGANITPYLSGFTGTQFTLNAFSSVVINGNITFLWLVIG